MLPKNSPNISPIVTVEISQLRERNTERSRIGSSSVSSQIISAISATAATIAAQTMKEDENQSSSRPLSTITWKAHTKTVRSSSPTTSIRLRSIGVSRSEEHTSELQSLMRISYAVFCLTKKNIRTTTPPIPHTHAKL